MKGANPSTGSVGHMKQNTFLSIHIPPPDAHSSPAAHTVHLLLFYIPSLPCIHLIELAGNSNVAGYAFACSIVFVLPFFISVLSFYSREIFIQSFSSLPQIRNEKLCERWLFLLVRLFVGSVNFAHHCTVKQNGLLNGYDNFHTFNWFQKLCFSCTQSSRWSTTALLLLAVEPRYRTE
ncbi:hypothetical protein T4E_3645 [Trichinella pseudospiralis]|uniref:Uncharacterized protein n=1 Tax=Trichinella pseudospiralis TaxID=6337 RepID=A0A0V0YBF0_TRIPS|nr:hypothetical protein T4E_3645 [Trichinella pseudospiralis]